MLPVPIFYLIPGLGADGRVFHYLRLQGEVHVLHWLPPHGAREPLPHYAARLAAAVPVEQACWLVGVSFGGVLALALGELRPLARVVLISSLASPRELPWVANLARATGLHRLLPMRWLALGPRVAQWFFSVENDAEYQLLRAIIRDTDLRLARWAIGQIVHWSGSSGIPVARIHGTHDRLLPRGAAHSHYQLPGGHFIIVSRAVEISQLLNYLAAPAAFAPQPAPTG
ncbi:alpha/beta fold hydrolase [Hymenobacter sp. BT664]|uniref:Alpha/beta fold hydrolase n=1 Tax=Hymenobacter montanus TaxID=2771359 RepID=A0A927GKY9_9BACT|nr:alpha/beta hydrolase [Hymenobacter montanus]MBD2769631.1 alpha/beta fold hydrolase [Hymenobacter montanus]